MWVLKDTSGDYVEHWTSSVAISGEKQLSKQLYTQNLDKALRFDNLQLAMRFLINRTYWAGKENDSWNSGIIPTEVREVSTPRWEEVPR